jgi:hypothetical protein
MALDIRASGRGTISSTLGAGGVTPSVTIASSDTRSFLAASSAVIVSVKNGVKDINGDIGLEWVILNNTQARVSATRQIPAGSEITFDWISIQD